MGEIEGQMLAMQKTTFPTHKRNKIRCFSLGMPDLDSINSRIDFVGFLGNLMKSKF